jgi:ComF family protein
MLTEAANAAIRLLLAPGCAACDEVLARPLQRPICDACWSRVRRITSPMCVRCGDELPLACADAWCARCRERPPRFSAAQSAGRYEGPLREIIHVFKYRGRRLLAPALGTLMRVEGAAILDGVDAAVPVPLHPLRRLRRGFNQADDLAVCLGVPVWRVLRRTRAGRPQADLPAHRRHANVAGAFATRSRVLAPLEERRLRGRTIVLVDDVMTTGATLDACSGVLLDAGVREVRALTAARAVAARPR